MFPTLRFAESALPDELPAQSEQPSRRRSSHPPQRRSGDDEDDLRILRIWRPVAIATATALIAITVLTDSFGRLLIDPTFHISEVVFGTLVAAWTGLLSVESIALLRSARKDTDNE
jgi:hypothetical protein